MPLGQLVKIGIQITIRISVGVPLVVGGLAGGKRANKYGRSEAGRRPITLYITIFVAKESDGDRRRHLGPGRLLDSSSS